jgi:hypothetical protein
MKFLFYTGPLPEQNDCAADPVGASGLMVKVVALELPEAKLPSAATVTVTV